MVRLVRVGQGGPLGSCSPLTDQVKTRAKLASMDGMGHCRANQMKDSRRGDTRRSTVDSPRASWVMHAMSLDPYFLAALWTFSGYLGIGFRSQGTATRANAHRARPWGLWHDEMSLARVALRFRR